MKIVITPHHCLFLTLHVLPLDITRIQSLSAEYCESPREGKRDILLFSLLLIPRDLSTQPVSAPLFPAVSTPLHSELFLAPPASALPVPECWIRSSIISAIGSHAGHRC